MIALQSDLFHHLAREFGDKARSRYVAIFEELRNELGYADYLGALERYRQENLHDPRLLRMDQLVGGLPVCRAPLSRRPRCSSAREALGQRSHPLRRRCCVQPRKVERSGLWKAFGGHVLIFIHKENELAAVEKFYPAKHYVMVDDKLRILQTIKDAWKDRVTTVFPQAGPLRQR